MDYSLQFRPQDLSRIGYDTKNSSLDAQPLPKGIDKLCGILEYNVDDPNASGRIDVLGAKSSKTADASGYTTITCAKVDEYQTKDGFMNTLRSVLNAQGYSNATVIDRPDGKFDIIIP